jgi:hypothetical protein
VEIPHIVEIPHRVETLPPHGMFYFRAMQSFHDNRPRGTGGRAAGGRTAPASITFPVISARRPGGPVPSAHGGQVADLAVPAVVDAWLRWACQGAASGNNAEDMFTVEDSYTCGVKIFCAK